MENGKTQTYFLPLTLAWEEREEELLRALAPHTIARTRQQASVGVLADAFGDESFVRALVTAVGAGGALKCARGEIRFNPTSAFATLAGAEPEKLGVTMPSAQSTNTIATLGDRLFLKGYRRLDPGANSEVEIGRHLTEVAPFAHIVPVAGSVDYVADDGRGATLALVQGYVLNQGNGWDFTLNYLDRFFEDASTQTNPGWVAADQHGAYLALARTLGLRTGELHAALARTTGDPAFDPQPMGNDDVAAWVQRVRAESAEILDRLDRRRGTLPEAIRGDAERLLASRDALTARIAAHAGDRPAGAKTRLHGDYHLGQVLVVRNDFVITDFEGEPGRTTEQRREKVSPLKDVAGMLRSFDYAMHAALFNFLSERPDARQNLETAARQWRALTAQAFSDGYEEAAQQAGLASAGDQKHALVELFVLEKALYELRYEAENRPDWLRIPLAGLLDIVDAEVAR